MKYGVAIELMDGDNSFIPIKWVCALLSKLEKLCHEDDKKKIKTSKT